MGKAASASINQHFHPKVVDARIRGRIQRILSEKNPSAASHIPTDDVTEFDFYHLDEDWICEYRRRVLTSMGSPDHGLDLQASRMLAQAHRMRDAWTYARKQGIRPVLGVLRKRLAHGTLRRV